MTSVIILFLRNAYMFLTIPFITLVKYKKYMARVIVENKSVIKLGCVTPFESIIDS